MKIENVAFVGMGALGILFGDHLTRALGQDRVGFVVDRDRMARYADQEITSNDHPCHFRFIPAEEHDHPADLVIFAVKGPALEQAMSDAAGQIGKNTILLSLLNGISSERMLEERFGRQNVVYCVAQGMDAVKTGFHLNYTSMGQICVGAPDEDRVPALDAVCGLFRRTNLPYTREDNIQHRLWCKLMLNAGVNQVCMVFEGGYGIVTVPGKPREMMIAAMREVMALAKCEGIDISEDDLVYYVNLLDDLSPDGMPSMRQDGLAKRKSEVELFAGTVCRMAKQHDLAVPVNDWLCDRILETERAY